MRGRVIAGSALTALSLAVLLIPSAAQATQPAAIKTEAAATSLVTVPESRMGGEDEVMVHYIDSGETVSALGEISVYPALGRTYYLQRNDGGTWIELESFVTSATNLYDSFEPTVPMPTTEGNVEYRIYAPASTYDAEFVSRPIFIGYQNLGTYQAQRDEAVSIISPYCSDVYEVAYAAPMDDAAAGLYMEDTLTILLASDIAGKELHDVALHECAHGIQDNTAEINGMENLDELEAILYPIYGDFQVDVPFNAQSGVEQNADCMMFLMGAVYDQGGYVDRGFCTGAKRDAAQAVLEGRLP